MKVIHISKKHEKQTDSEASGASTSNGMSKLLWPGISAALLIILMVSLFWNQNTTATLSKDEVSAQVQSLVEQDLQGAATARVANVTEESGLYKLAIVVSANGRDSVFSSYTTKDGKLLFPQAIDVEAFMSAPKEPIQDDPASNPSASIPKADVPTVQLFVMSQCPYGVQAENAIKPVLDSLKGKIKFELRFIANQNQDGTFSSLHGQGEVDENMRQMCAMNVYPNYMDYVICRNANYRSNDWESCATKSGMNAQMIKTCAEGKEGEGLLAKNIELANQLSVGGSPTIMINSQNYQGQRTAQAFMSAICSAFTDPPAECSAGLGNVSAQADQIPEGGCGA